MLFPSLYPPHTLNWIIYNSTNRKFVGNYENQIEEALADQGISNPTDFQKNNSLFYCNGPPGGTITWRQTCQDVCVNAGHDIDDSCLGGNDHSCLKGSDFPVSNVHNRLKTNPPTEDENRILVINW